MKLPIYTISLIALTLHANDLPIITSLNEDMSQTTQIATQNNQNIDYQPFILSVWEQKDLFSFGVLTLKDALMLLPGVDMMGDSINNRTMVVRGSNPLAYGQSKLVIDGIIVNDQSFDSYNTYLNFPIELIKRIEVVRGSGSFIEGVNGYSGTINVITMAHDTANEKEHGTYFGSLGNDSSKRIGFWQTFDYNQWKLSLDGFYYSDKASSPISVTDKYGNTGYAPLNNSQRSLSLSLMKNNLYLKGRINDYTYGSAFGNLNALPNSEGKQSTPSWYLESSMTHSLSSDLSLKAKAGIAENSWESDARSLPPCDILSTCSYSLSTPNHYPNGYWADLKLKNQQYYANASITYTGLRNHSLLFGYTFKHEKVTDIQSITTERIDGGTVLTDYSDTAPFLDADAAHRLTHEYYIGDTIEINDQLALVLNAGGTKATNIPFHQYKRAALIYQPYRQHILKCMVGTSYRLPSWQELYTINNPARIGNPNLDPEHVTSYELQYIYKPSISTFLSFNAFYLQNKSQITANTLDNTFQNIGRRNIKGIETEFRGSISENDLFAFSYSYINGNTYKNNEVTDYLPYASSHLLKGAFSYTLTPEVKAGIVSRYSSEKARRPNDPRTPMKSFTSLDLILGWENLQGFYLQGAVKNLGNAIYRYPSTPSTYPDDYPVEDRTFWLRTGWKF